MSDHHILKLYFNFSQYLLHELETCRLICRSKLFLMSASKIYGCLYLTIVVQ